MILLEPDRYEMAILRLMDVAINNLFARSVVEKHVDGKVYVDDDTNPNAFYVVHPYGMSLLYGNVSDGFFSHHLVDYLLNRNGQRASVEFLQVYPEAIAGKIDHALAEGRCRREGNRSNGLPAASVVKHTRVNFRFDRSRFDRLLSTIDLGSFCFRKVDRTVFDDFKGSVVPNRFWNHAGDFLQHGIGYTLRCGDQDVAVAFSSFVHEDRLELGMETREAYRRKGFGSIVCAKLMACCIEKALEPVWACRLDNLGSYRLARKLGFEPTAHLPYYELPL